MMLEVTRETFSVAYTTQLGCLPTVLLKLEVVNNAYSREKLFVLETAITVQEMLPIYL